MAKPYDYLIVGAGLFGCVFAREAVSRGRRCLVIEKRDHIAGNAYTETIADICVHRYGAHVFHTDNERVWRYVSRFARMNGYIHAPMARCRDGMYNLPFNMNTFSRLWGLYTPDEAQAVIDSQRTAADLLRPDSLARKAVGMAGTDIFEKFIRGYTEKQWGKSAESLPASIIERVPMRLTYDNRYFDDRWQGVPEEGYTALCERLLEGVDVRLSTDFFADRPYFETCAAKIVYTGRPDAFFGCCFGALAWRGLRFETDVLLGVRNYQGAAVVHYTDNETPFTRVIEHKHFACGTQPDTVVTREYPCDWREGAEPYYPLNDAGNDALYARYRRLAGERGNVILAGRLGEYRYMDMDDVILRALETADAEMGPSGGGAC